MLAQRYLCAIILDVYLSFLFACTVTLTLVSDPTSRRFIRWLLFQTYIYIYIYIYIQVSVRDITLECLQITPTNFRQSKFPGNIHNYIWCPYYLPSFMKFCSVVSEELHWQTVWRTDGQDKNNVSPQKWGET